MADADFIIRAPRNNERNHDGHEPRRPSRRAMVGALAALPVASVPMLAHAAAANPDPIFALIEAAKGAKCALDVASKIDACLTNEVGTWDGVTITMRAPESLVQYGFGTYKALCRGELEETLDHGIIYGELRGRVRRCVAEI